MYAGLGEDDELRGSGYIHGLRFRLRAASSSREGYRYGAVQQVQVLRF